MSDARAEKWGRQFVVGIRRKGKSGYSMGERASMAFDESANDLQDFRNITFQLFEAALSGKFPNETRIAQMGEAFQPQIRIGCSVCERSSAYENVDGGWASGGF
ncbi:unnamed protein product [Nippostrongylus brasiliensis]|uniref:Uncharacterized protein n=1 Tax=Nippostrongylus brasiliensis TaxID=27835 RepID=A0A0N4XXF9_NIPBR|nr:unnamed protein product [Nippostrongylus brasiliensis]